jgi:hypothetical protein
MPVQNDPAFRQGIQHWRLQIAVLPSDIAEPEVICKRQDKVWFGGGVYQTITTITTSGAGNSGSCN